MRANIVAPGYVKSRLTEVLPEEATQAMLANASARPARGAGGRGARCTVPLFRLEASYITGGASSTVDWACSGGGMNGGSDNGGRKRVAITGMGMVSSLGSSPRSAELGARSSRAGRARARSPSSTRASTRCTSHVS